MNKVVIVEDDIELRDSLADYLIACGEDVTGVGSAIELYQLIAQNTYDVALVDVNLPHYDGLSITSYLAEKTDLAIILMTVQGGIDDRVRGYNSGADLYMVKPVNCEELAAAINSLAKRRKRTAPPDKVAATQEWCVDRLQFRLAPPAGGVVPLTRKEIQFLEMLADNPGKIVARNQVMKTLGYNSADAESRALDAAISRLRSKVYAESGTPLPVQTIQGSGYVFSGSIRLA
ncbi:response regulator transcription factor [Rhizobium sp. KVB221]|uniref:Response regulator transcription factor n=1 Tax=Rhizobium setariae TaxID=2801340 RepID=A0A936YRN3_9HYPH|nr:response regulator transcription factor [Rhizobium setariae]